MSNQSPTTCRGRPCGKSPDDGAPLAVLHEAGTPIAIAYSMQAVEGPAPLSCFPGRTFLSGISIINQTINVTGEGRYEKAKSVNRFGAALVAIAIPLSSFALPPSPAFNGKVLDIFINNTAVLVEVQGGVKGSCTGLFANYNLTFDLADPQGQRKLILISDAFLYGKIIAGSVKGCGSSNINKLFDLAIADQKLE
jgi:hypothetical protein